MAGEGGHRPYWPTHLGVNLSNGNLCLTLGQGTCVTCGGSGGGSAYPNPQSTTLNGPTLIYNALGTADSDLGSKWMLPYHTYMTVDGSGNVTLIDADGTQRVFNKDATSTPQTYTANKEREVLTSDGTNYYLKRWNGDIWQFGMSSKTLDSITSRTTHTITLARDGNGRITTITDGFGRVTKLFYVTYDGKTRLNEYREPAPGDVGFQSTFFQYDSSGRLTVITNPIGEMTRFTYDGSDRIATAIDGHGHATIYTTTSNQITNIEDPAGNSTVFDYSGPTTVTDRLSNDTVYEFDLGKRVVKITDALLNEREWTYDSTSWEVLTYLGPKIPQSGTPWTRQRVTNTYNSGANRHELQSKALDSIDNSSVVVALKTESWTYNAQHDVLTYTNPLGKVWTNTYQLDGSSNSVGLVLTVVNPLNQTVTTNDYGSSGDKYRLESTKNGVNDETTFAYNQNTANSYGTPDKITAPSTAVTNLKVDVRGRIYEQTGPSGNTDKFEFDALDRMIRHINPDGTSLIKKFDCCHLAAEVDENELGTSMEYDVLGQLVKITDANGEETTIGYNDEGWQTTITDPRGEVTTNTFDELGRITQIEYPGGWLEIMTYFEPGHLKTLKNKKGATETTITMVYDAMYRLIKKDFASGTDTEYEWDAASRVTKMKDASGEKRYTYDDADRLTKVEQGPIGFVINTDHNYKIEYTWNAASQCTAKDLTIRTKSTLGWINTFTDDGQLDTVTNPDDEDTVHLYLTDGRLKKITLTTGSTREQFYQDTDSSHAYVANKNKHLRKTLDKKSGGTVICSYDYELDPAGNRLSVTDKDSKYIKYGLDPKYQLTNETQWSAKVPGTRNLQYAYVMDANGNWLFQHKDGVVTSYTIGDNNEVTNITGIGAIDYDHYGSVVAYSDVSLTYDFERHMTHIEDENAHTDDHEYDGNGRRMRSKLNGAANWTHFIHDELTEEILCEYTLVSSTFTIKSVNTYGVGLISTNRDSGTKRYFHFDGLGSTRALTDGSQDVLDKYNFSAYGIQESITGSSVNPFRFVGQWGYYDDGARGSTFGLLLLGIRYYIPSWGRFLVWDSIRQTNRYFYARNAPSLAIDPTGKISYVGCDGNPSVTLAYKYGCRGLLSCFNNPPCWKKVQDCVSRCGIENAFEVAGCMLHHCTGAEEYIVYCNDDLHICHSTPGACAVTLPPSFLNGTCQTYICSRIGSSLCPWDQTLAHEMSHCCGVTEETPAYCLEKCFKDVF